MSRKQVGRIAVSGVVPSMSRVVCSLQVTGRQEEPMCRSGITQCMKPVNAEALGLPFTAPLGKMARLYRPQEGSSWACIYTSIAFPASAAT